MPQKARQKKVVQKKRDNTTLFIIIGAAAVVVVLLLVLLNMNLNTRTIDPVISATGKVWGKADAPVTIDEYADFQCPVCGQASKVIQQIAPKYLDTGKAKVVFHHFAFIGQESQWAAEASECARDQNKFWEFADYIYAHQAGENAGAFSKDNLKKLAQQMGGLDMATFNSCLDSDQHSEIVRQETAEGQRLGVQATPTFFVNGQKIEGLLQANQFAQLIDSLQK